MHMIYDLLNDGGYFVFETFEDSEAKTSRDFHKILYDIVKKKFGSSNIKIYQLNEDVYHARKALIRQNQIKEPKEHENWDYSPLSFPLEVYVKLHQLSPDSVGKWLSNKKNQNKIKSGDYQYNEITREVFEKVIVKSVDLFQEIDERTKEVSQIDPILAKYPHTIIVAMKKVESIEGVKRKKQKEKIGFWEKIKRQPTKTKILQILGFSTVAIIIVSMIYRWKKYRRN